LETGVLVLLLHCKFSCIVGDRILVLLLHTAQQKHENDCLQQYRNIYSAAAAIKLLSRTIQEHLQCRSSTKTPVSNNTGKFTVQKQH
jgi:hypothetical protein